MAYKKDIRPWLKQVGKTWEEMDAIWEELCEINWKCKSISESGKLWSDLTMYQIEQLPTLKEETLKQLKEKEELEKEKERQEQERKEQEHHYEKNFEEIMYSKIVSGEALTERELSRLLRFEIEREDGDELRWTKFVYSIIELKDKFFQLSWQCGLTEYQEDIFDSQPFEVKRHEYEKVITVVSWEAV